MARNIPDKWPAAFAVILILTGLVTALVGFFLPWYHAGCTLPEDDWVIAQQDDGSLLLSWPQATSADRYLLEIRDGESGILYSQYTDTHQALLPRLPSDRAMTLRISAEADYKTLTGRASRISGNAPEVTTRLNPPQITVTHWAADPVTGQVFVKYDAVHCDQVLFSLLPDGAEPATREITGGTLTLSFGDNGDYPIPRQDELYIFRFRGFRQETGIRFLGAVSTELALSREDFLGRDPALVCTDSGNNTCRLTWAETKGEAYEVQKWDASENAWITLCQIPVEGERSYTSGHLASCTAHTFRVVAIGGQTVPESGYAAVSEEVTFTTGRSSLYATVWPITDLPLYRNPSRKGAIGTAAAGEAYCVLEETDGFFAVSVNGTVGYIDSRYCLINLPEYLGDLCSYDIANSYSALYMIHEFEIPKVTDVITAGYENIRLSDGSFLVPLLYPTAQKLAVAAENALGQGYRLKIYDTFRPYKATRQIYDRTEAILSNSIPAKTFTGVSRQSLNLPDGKVTYRNVMTDGSHDLNAFLAKSGSTHNQGIALDLTLEDAATGQEPKMQTRIHDLSHHSLTRHNTTAANTLAAIMTQAGFGTLSTEWWHFQDNEARRELKLPYFYGGLSCAGWVRDHWDWKYRTADGEFYRDTTVTIRGKTYCFNTDGYLTYG